VSRRRKLAAVIDSCDITKDRVLVYHRHFVDNGALCTRISLGAVSGESRFRTGRAWRPQSPGNGDFEAKCSPPFEVEVVAGGLFRAESADVGVERMPV